MHRVALLAVSVAMAAAVHAGCASSNDGAGDAAASSPDSSGPRDGAAGDGDGDADYGDASQSDADGDAISDAAVVELDGATRIDASDLDAAANDDGAAMNDDAGDGMLPAIEELPYVREIIAYEPGASAGFGQAMLPDVVYGPPMGRGTGSGSLDVLSLGVGGEIVIGFGEHGIVDGDGADFIVFENAFIGGGELFLELGEVAVSEDGATWHTFACDEAGNAGVYEGCAGWTPTLRYDPQRVFPLDPELSGGDAFDLEALGLGRARYVRIRDLETKPGTANTGGFDLDAVGLVHYEAIE
jgi:hypothetical protein